jgi:hypothetical protein
MKKLTASIILSCFFSLVYSQNQTKALINLKLIDSHNKKAIKLPEVKVKTFQGLDTLVTGDSLGNVLLNVSFKRNQPFLIFHISKHNYYSSSTALPIDTNLTSIKIDTTFEISPQLICADNCILPDIYFDFNQSEMNQFTKKENSLDSINVIEFMPFWVASSVANPPIKNAKLEIISFSDYNENNKISSNRLSIVSQKLISLGFPKDKIILTNKNKQDRIQIKYRDGCYPYYYFDNPHLKIDNNLIDSETNAIVEAELRKLRQVITFNWVLEKN